MDHPLKNKDCLYYELYTGMESIDVLEKVFTQQEMTAWAKISLMAYQLRLGKKSGTKVDVEIKKMETFKNYIEYLEAMK